MTTSPVRWLAALCLVIPSAAFAQDLLSPEAQQLFTLTPWTQNLGQLTDFRFLPDGRAIIVAKTGEIRVRQTDGTLLTAGQLDVDTASEKGLLGVEVDPAFASNGFVYLYYSCAAALGSEPCDDLNENRVSRFVLGPDGMLDLNSETLLVHGLRGPANHDGGALAIGPDGKLYVGVGDSGCDSNQPPGQGISNWFATCLTNGNGKILRVDLDGTVPGDDPLSNETAVTACGANCGDMPSATSTAAPRTDIWAWGFRNPWRFWFDPRTGHLWVGDVGENTFEELDVVEGGKHYGWPFREGADGQPVESCATMTPQSGDCVDPVYRCRHGATSMGIDGNCTSINAGLIVDSCTWPSPWRGRYFFGDNSNGALYFLDLNSTRTGPVDAGMTSPRGNFGSISGGAPISFQVGPDGNLYIGVFSTTQPGRILQMAPISPESCSADGGTPDADGGTGDGGTPGVDGGGSVGVIPPGGFGNSEPTPASGCGCGESAGATSALVLLAIAAVFARRRRA